MPIYEYECEKCGKEFEELVFGDDDTPVCPYCGASTTHKMMSCCAHHGAKTGSGSYEAPVSSGGGCAGCSGGNCASCGH